MNVVCRCCREPVPTYQQHRLALVVERVQSSTHSHGLTALELCADCAPAVRDMAVTRAGLLIPDTCTHLQARLL